MRRILLALCLLLLITGYVAAQDTSAEDMIRRRIQAAVNGETTLLLAHLGLTEVPSEVLLLTHLDTLDLAGNYLTSIPPEISQLTNLSYLNLASNQLSVIPSEIGQLANLQLLYLSHNQLTNLPPEIGQLTNLTALTLSGNQLTALPSEIGRLTNLLELHLGNNLLRHLPPEMGNLTKLTCKVECFMDLSRNPLISPPPEVIEQGTAAVLAYLRNQAWYHIQRLIISGASGIGLLAMLILGVRWKQRGGRKSKKRKAKS